MLLVLGVGLLVFVALGQRDLWNPNEPIYGRATAEMAERGDWLVPTVNGKVFAEKPILYYWLALGAAELRGGVDELSLRVPAALAGLLSAWLTYLLVLPYGGRRRALLTAALFATSYQVFWASRTVQMDVLVLASTLGILVPLTRMLDFGAAPGRAWLLAGIAAGLGFASKGPVTWIVPAVIFCGYVVLTGRFAELRRPQILVAAVAAVAVGSPWYLVLWSQGETAFLYEALIRQNFGRFVSAWDHVQPWWYYLKYIWLDYAPWSFFLPAALLLRAESETEARLHRLSWVWIVAVIAFFSLSESKRAPYILPIAPAVAALAAGVLQGLSAGRLRPAPRRLALAALVLFALIFLAAAPAAVIYRSEIPPRLSALAAILAGLMALAGSAVAVGILARRRLPCAAPAALFGGIVTLYLVAVILVFPAMNPRKSARAFADRLADEVDPGAEVVSYRFWDWRAGYAYYAKRNIPNLKTPAELTAFWREGSPAYVLVEAPHDEEVRQLLPDASQIYSREIGGRTAFLFVRGGPRTIAEQRSE